MPAIFSVLESNLIPVGSPLTVSFGSDSEATHAPRSSSYVPSAAVVASASVTVRLALSSASVANSAVSATSASVAT